MLQIVAAYGIPENISLRFYKVQLFPDNISDYRLQIMNYSIFTYSKQIKI